MLFSASQIHDGYDFLPSGTVVEVNAAGCIQNIHPPFESDEIVHHEGIICPGFVNAHCHMELSHLQGAIPSGTGLIPFLQTVTTTRNNFSGTQRKAAMGEAFREMLRNGIVAVGDIVNTPETLDLRASGKMHFHTFTECIGFTEVNAPERFVASEIIFESFKNQAAGSKILRQSIVPHAPYSVSEKLFKIIDQYQPESLLTIHNQECAAENEYYQSKSGAVNDLLQGFGIDDAFFNPCKLSSLKAFGQWLSPSHPLILVHNTFTTEADIAFAKARFPQLNICLCPNTNLYIENRLPDVKMLASQGVNICLGTDSLASNNQLSILAEIKTLQQHFPKMGLEKWLRCATLNGAKALQMERETGNFEKGKNPGVLLLSEDLCEVQVLA